MPYIHLTSNLPKTGVDTASVVSALSKSMSLAYGVPEAVVMAMLTLDETAIFGGLDTPSAYLQVRTVGKVDKEHNTKNVQVLTAKVTELLGVPADRVFIVIDDIPAVNWGSDDDECGEHQAKRKYIRKRSKFLRLYTALVKQYATMLKAQS
ncbi:Macrophage migration inhibitory factor, partial [Globisporangium splendens]